MFEMGAAHEIAKGISEVKSIKEFRDVVSIKSTKVKGPFEAIDFLTAL